MAWSGTGGDVPAARVAMAVNDLIQAHDGAARIRTHLLQLQLDDDRRAAWAAQLEIDGVLTRLSSAMSALDVSDAAAAVVRSSAAGSDGARPQPRSGSSPCGGGNKRKQSSSRRSQRPSEKKITDALEDGHVWRKYGQKEIQDSPYPRSYYRCTHKTDQGCGAKRQVQCCDTDDTPKKYVVIYYGEHTCRDLSTVPLVDQAAAAAARAEPGDDDHASNNLMISFGPSSTAASSSQYLAMGAADHQQLSTSSWCTSDDVFSSSAGSFMQIDELIGAVVASAAGVTSSVAPDRGVLGGGMASGVRGSAASFPPSPNSLGFVVGSLGSIGGGEGHDDDMFRLDP